MDLLPFDVAKAGTVASWPVSAAEVAKWCGRRDFPMPAQLVASWQQADDVQAHMLVDGDRLVGYGELWFDDEEDEIELARIIVAPDHRGAGLGRTLVRGLTDLARKAGQSDIFLRVHPGHDQALRCYRAAGFAEVDASLATEWNKHQPVKYVWLTFSPAAG